MIPIVSVLGVYTCVGVALVAAASSALGDVWYTPCFQLLIHRHYALCVCVCVIAVSASVLSFVSDG